MMLAPLVLVLASAHGLMAVPPGGTNAEADAAAKSYMANSGVSLEVARRRLQIESELPPYIDALRSRYRDRVAFISVESSPDQHILVGLKGAAMESRQQITVSGSRVGVEFEPGYLYNEREFKAVLSRSIPRITELIPRATGIIGRPELGMIQVRISGGNVDEYKAAVEEIQRATKLKVELIPGASVPRNLAYTTGGGILQANGRTCTTGLAVMHKTTLEKGLITAAHCDDQLIYSNYSQTVGGPQVLFPLNFKSGIMDANHDVQWHTLPAGNQPEQAVFAENTHEYQKRAIILLYDGPPINVQACFRGARTGFSCGVVTSVDYTPVGPGVCGITSCDSTWALVQGPQLKCAGGDSGAAVFNNGSGYGIVKAAENPSDSTLPGDCAGLTVMPFGRISSLGLKGL